MVLTSTEEQYLKGIFQLSEKDKKSVSTNALALQLNTTPASVTDMLKKLEQKELIHYKKYFGVSLTQTGSKAAIAVLRRQRLWNTFLMTKLRFGWHQVMDISDELEHIHSNELTNRLDAFLDYPKFDPFGDPVPNAEARLTIRQQIPLLDMPIGQNCILLGVREHDPEFLKHLTNIHIKLGCIIHISRKSAFDHSMQIIIDNKYDEIISEKVAQLILVKQL
jgi:DtxR family Mn-dependent transcriptional regulator